jgi:hypothetical protein
MDEATHIAAEINERLVKDVVPMDEVRARAEHGQVILEGSRVLRLAGAKRTIFTREPEKSDAAAWIAFPPENAVEAVNELMRGWPHG